MTAKPDQVLTQPILLTGCCVQAVTSACVASLSDIIAQRLIGTPYSLQRTLKMAVSRRPARPLQPPCMEGLSPGDSCAAAMLLLHVNTQLWGLLIGAPTAHFWHAYLQKWFARKADTFETAIHKVTRPQLHSPLAATQRSSEVSASRQPPRSSAAEAAVGHCAAAAGGLGPAHLWASLQPGLHGLHVNGGAQ